PLTPAPRPPADPHNAPTHSCAPNTPSDYPHATQTHPGNAGSPRPPARPPHRPTDRSYSPRSFSEYPTTDRYRSSSPYPSRYSAAPPPPNRSPPGRATPPHSSHADRTAPASAYS